MHQLRQDAFEMMTHARFISLEHKLAMFSFVSHAHVTEQQKLAIFDDRAGDTRRMIQYAAQCTPERAAEIHQDLIDCGALGPFAPVSRTSNGHRRLIDWVRATEHRPPLAKVA